MRKLSEVQSNALQFVKEQAATSVAVGGLYRSITWESLAARDLIVITERTGKGEVLAVSLPVKADQTDREKYEGTAARFNPEVIDQVHGHALTLNTPAPKKAEPGMVVLYPVFEEPRPNTIYGKRPVQAVQADRDHLVQTYGEKRADEILDTWETVENRADRRNGNRRVRAEGRREMRLRRTPSRRRFTTQAALIRKAERRAAKIQAA
jgi:hypothetical protein